MAKQVIFSEEARKKVKTGIDKVANAVRVTMGPKGRNVLLGKTYGGPTITNDGVSIATGLASGDTDVVGDDLRPHRRLRIVAP